MTREYIIYETDSGVIEREEIVRCHDCCNRDKRYYCTVLNTTVKRNDFCSMGDKHPDVSILITIPRKTNERLRSDYGHGYFCVNDEDAKVIIKAIYNGKVVIP